MTATQKQKALIALLKDHSEGILLYNGNLSHAVHCIGYINKQFIVVDPARGMPSGAMPLTAAYKFSGGVDAITKVWFIVNPDIPAPHVCSSSSAASCTADKTCDGCGAVMQSKLGHDFKSTVTKPTCTEQGYTTFECSRCHETYADGKVSATGHTPGEAATCTSPQTCKACGVALAQAIGHDYKSTVTKPTCTEQGYTTFECSRCHETYADGKVSATGHTPGEDATCESPRICVDCGAVLADACGHDYDSSKALPTCTEPGQTVFVCRNCGDSYTEVHEEPLGHMPGAEATCKSEKCCTVCHTVLEQRRNHSYTYIATSTECYALVHYQCEKCGDECEMVTYFENAHQNTKWVIDIQPTVDACGSRILRCEECNKILGMETIPVLEEHLTETSAESETTKTNVLPTETQTKAGAESTPPMGDMGCASSAIGVGILGILLSAAVLLLVRRKSRWD